MRFVAVCLLSLFCCGVSTAAEKTNLLFIFLDDFGWKDTSYMGSDFYETPHLDKLAREGMIFTNGYSSAANCAPARACLLTGQYSPRHEIYNVGTGPRGKAAHRRLKHIPGTDTLEPGKTTWASVLQAGGYHTASMGKWHLSNDPRDYGFDENLAGSHSGGPPKGYYPPHPKAPGLENVPGDEYLTDTLSKAAASYVRENAGRPWVLYLTHFAVHTPLDAKKELLQKYKDKKPGVLHDHAVMATMIQAVDDGVGLIVKALEESGQADRTAIVFSSDNGGYGPATDMDPLKGYKGAYYEGGIRVPYFIKWPGRVSPGSQSDIPVIGVDLFPTFCEMLGVEIPSGLELDGRSLVPILTGKAGEEWNRRPLFWHFPAYLQSYGGKGNNLEQRDPLFRTRPCSVVRIGNWKLHEYYEDGALELYDLNADIGEATNLAETQPERLAELHGVLQEWREKTGAPVPSEKNPEFDAEEEKAAIEKALR